MQKKVKEGNEMSFWQYNVLISGVLRGARAIRQKVQAYVFTNENRMEILPSLVYRFDSPFRLTGTECRKWRVPWRGNMRGMPQGNCSCTITHKHGADVARGLPGWLTS